MFEYLQLQYRMTNRKLATLGFHPVVGYLVLLLVFVGGSCFLYLKTDYANYLYTIFTLSIIAKLSERRRNYFLKSIYNKIDYLKLRLIENSIILFPFLVFLAFKQSFYTMIIICVIGLSMALVNFRVGSNFTIPTPFSKRPFEFVVGFRNTFYFYFGIAFLLYQSIITNNFNLGVFAFIIVYLISISYYSKPENEYYVWIFNQTPKEFLLEKIKIALWNTTLLSIPVIGILVFYFPSFWYFVLLVLLMGYLYLSTFILAKYSNFPNEMNLPHGIMFGVCFMFPPLILVLIPYFYSLSTNRLNALLL